MNYGHIFHAGNFADVFKHVVLVHVLKALRRKDTGFCYIETHAGRGRYDLRAPESEKTGEHRDGIGRLWVKPQDQFDDYLAAVRAVNSGRTLHEYPGSPRIARFWLRPQDRMRLCERKPEECARLQADFSGELKVHVHCGDGYAALKAWLPPQESRGCVFIDPAYENDDEFERVLTSLRDAHARWAIGVYAVWYPIKDRAANLDWRRAVTAIGLRKTLVAELALFPEDNAFRLNGCGMVLVNPPWQLDGLLERELPQLLEVLKHGTAGRCDVTWLVPE